MRFFILPIFILRIIIIFARQGILLSLLRGQLKENDGIKLSYAFEQLGPSFIKFGQVLSVRPDLVGHNLADQLSRLQDKLPPAPFKKVVKDIEFALQAPIDDIFSEFNREAVAAASIAQVYKGKLKSPINSHLQYHQDSKPKIDHDGWVAVKVLRPNIRKKFERDLALFRSLASLLLVFMPKIQRLRPLQIVDTMQSWVDNELDLRLEAAASVELRDNFDGEDDFQVPLVDWRYNSEKVMISQWVDGIRIDDVNALKAAGHDLDALLEKCTKFFLFQIFRDGFFHADIHPGNVLITQNGCLTVLDFGIMGRITPQRRLFLAELLMGFLRRDYKRIAEIHFEHGITPYDQSLGQFTQSLCAVGEPLMNLSPEEISIGRLLTQMLDVTEKFKMPLQTDLLLLQKTILMAEGLGKMLNPKVNMWLQCQNILEDWMIANHGPEAKLLQLGQRLFGLIEQLQHTPYDDVRQQDKQQKKSSLSHGVKITILVSISAIIGYYASLLF